MIGQDSTRRSEWTVTRWERRVGFGCRRGKSLSSPNSGRSGWEGPWRRLAQDGWAGISQHYERVDGGYRALVDLGGAALDERVMLYDQAFVLFAMASLERLGPRQSLAPAASALLSGPVAQMRHPRGGFVEADASAPHQSNPHMHLLEAAMAWEDLTRSKLWVDLANELVELALSRFIDPEIGVLREFFDESWAPAPGLAGRLVSPGHQFEWAWLLERWGLARGHEAARRAATRLFELGVAGVDPKRNVATDAMLDDLTVHKSTARLWPQTERLRAAISLAKRRDPQEGMYLAHAVGAARSLRRYLKTELPGLWRDSLTAQGSFIHQPAPASSFYHIVCALDELQYAMGYLGHA